MKNMTYILAASVAALATSAAAEQAKISGTITDIYGPRFVLDTPSGHVLIELSRRGADKVALKVGEKIDVEGNKTNNQMRAERVTLPDGHAYTTAGRHRTWREFLTGQRDPKSEAAFTSIQAAKFGADGGYTLMGEPTPKDKHFRVIASKNNADYELQIFRDGRLDAKPAFGMAESKKLAQAKGYKLTGEPIRMGNRFEVAATKDGKSVTVDIMRDGTIAEVTPFAATDAQKQARDKGYELVGEAKPVDAHFELLGKKDGKFYELRANRDGRLVQNRAVDASDPRWGPMIR